MPKVWGWGGAGTHLSGSFHFPSPSSSSLVSRSRKARASSCASNKQQEVISHMKGWGLPSGQDKSRQGGLQSPRPWVPAQPDAQQVQPDKGREQHWATCVDTAPVLRERWRMGTRDPRDTATITDKWPEPQTGREQNRENAGRMGDCPSPASHPQRGDGEQIGKRGRGLVPSFVYSSISPTDICSTC